MKTVLILLFAFAVQLPFVCGQNLFPLKTLADTLPFQVSAEGRQLVLNWLPGTKPWTRARDFAEIKSIRLADGDLLIAYLPPKNKPSLTYTFDVSILSASGVWSSPATLHYAPQNEPDDGARLLIWEDATERLREAGAVYTLFIRRSLMGAVNCQETRPEFTLARQLPIWATAGGGAILLGLGQLYNNQKKDLYANYRKIWREEGTEAAAQDFLNQAKRKNKTAQILTYSGWSALGLSAVWYAWQHTRIRKKQKIYDAFCRPESPGVSFKPAILESSASGATVFALSMGLSF